MDAVQKQIAKYQTNKGLIEAIDFLAIEKIALNALDYSKGTGESTVYAKANIDKAIALIIANKIIFNVPWGASNTDGSKTLLYENKILSHKTDESTGLAPVTILNIIENAPTMKLKYKISVENGFAVPEKTQTGGIMAKKNSYKRDKVVNIFLSEMDMNKFMMNILHYIQIHDMRMMQQ